MIALTLPQLSISMEDGKVLRWLVDDGASVTAGQPVVEIETDKATMEVESPADGVLRCVVAEGAVVAVESTLAEILDTAAQPVPTPSPVEGPAAVAVPAAGASRAGKHVASPAARRIARERGIDLGRLTGSGQGGRIVFADLERAGATAPATARDLRTAVVANIVASWRAIPHIHVAGELAAEGVVAARAAAGVGVTVTDLLIVAVAGALAKVPGLNGFVRDGRPEHVQRIDLALAIAGPTGVVAPVLRDAAGLGLAEVTYERARLVAAAREGRLEGSDLAGGTCTLSNLGAHPVDFFAPVVSGPQIALVATGRVAERPVAVDGMVAVRPRIWVNVAIDHRGADGEAGGRFLAALEGRISQLPAIVQGARR